MGQAGSEIWFYHLEVASVDETLPPLVEKCLERGWRAQIRSPSPERLRHLDGHLWSWKPASWLPHHGPDDPEGAKSPIQLISAEGTLANQQIGSEALFLLDGAHWGELTGVVRIFVLFDGREEEHVTHARQQWRMAKEAGLSPAYWRQTEDGRWAKTG
ncbi:hypothetical protein PbB2_00769 [Candidatus Phycosocius bacilliformis]|uniref:DNA polymerase III subunit chi n=1 Tax=Candidatus Phycosocius bacilliformis TaxID=1445552 RepID=A0A2P2E7S2_9PROT|nr:DNA polymerase III subunit chi [Candidatus Phycosocius bacilliformis]GBF57109.1 hypothetical protein PbB2_00769 [Candidatus Phycosocius bacilliformis]